MRGNHTISRLSRKDGLVASASMKDALPNQLTKKELAARWQCSTRTVVRRVRLYGLKPEDFIGNWPVWNVKAVELLERRRLAVMLKKGNYTAAA
jgi:hypothetical protein